MDNAIVQGEFVTYSHVKTRKTFSITIEFPEEQALHVLNTLGSPIGGNSKPVAVALLDNSAVKQPTQNNNTLSKNEKSEGEKLRIRAVMLCGDREFQDYAEDILPSGVYSDCALELVYRYCDITSRSELTHNEEAQEKFKQLDRGFHAWKVEQQYADNLSR